MNSKQYLSKYKSRKSIKNISSDFERFRQQRINDFIKSRSRKFLSDVQSIRKKRIACICTSPETSSDIINYPKTLGDFLKEEDIQNFEIDTFLPSVESHETLIYLNDKYVKLTHYDESWDFRAILPNYKYDYIVFFGCNNPYLAFGGLSNREDEYEKNIIFTYNKLKNNGKLIIIENHVGGSINRFLTSKIDRKHLIYTLPEWESCSRHFLYNTQIFPTIENININSIFQRYFVLSFNRLNMPYYMKQL